MKILILCTTDSMFTNFLVPHIHNMQNKGYIVECACSVTGDFFSILKEKYGFTMHEINFERNPFNLRNISAFKQLNTLVKQEKYDIIFCHEPVGGAMGRIVGHINHCTVVYMAHGFHFYKGAPSKMRLFYLVEKFLARWTDVLITINKEDYHASLGFRAKEKILTNGIGVDTSKFAYNPDNQYIRNELGLTQQDVILLSVGELIVRKNHEPVIRAIKKLNNPHVHFAIAGDGELTEYLCPLIKELNLEKQVHLLGYRTDINKLCNASDIYIMPSLQEGLSVALMEAMSCGKPVIVSKIRGNVDLVDEEKGGYLVGAKDIDGYKEAILKLISSHDNQFAFGEYNMKKVKNFDIKKAIEQIDSII
jgi:glycosyltransferase involved in cell wall biosynthesis